MVESDRRGFSAGGLAKADVLAGVAQADSAILGHGVGAVPGGATGTGLQCPAAKAPRANFGAGGADAVEVLPAKERGVRDRLVVSRKVSGPVMARSARVLTRERQSRIRQRLLLFAVLAKRSEGLDLPTGDAPDDAVQLGKRRVPFHRNQPGIAGLDEHQRFVQRLSAGPKVGQVRIVPARAFREFDPAGSLPAAKCGEDGIERSVEHEDHGARIRQRRSDRFHKQQLHPA